jgi:hypothetical protein
LAVTLIGLPTPPPILPAVETITRLPPTNVLPALMVPGVVKTAVPAVGSELKLVTLTGPALESLMNTFWLELVALADTVAALTWRKLELAPMLPNIDVTLTVLAVNAPPEMLVANIEFTAVRLMVLAAPVAVIVPPRLNDPAELRVIVLPDTVLVIGREIFPLVVINE